MAAAMRSAARGKTHRGGIRSRTRSMATSRKGRVSRGGINMGIQGRGK